MTDKKILEEVYRRVVAIAKNGDANVPSQVRFKEFKDFIEREWQKEDDLQEKLEVFRTEIFNLADDGQKYNMNELDVNENSAGEGAHGMIDAQEIERHRGLEIGEDGTVKSLN